MFKILNFTIMFYSIVAILSSKPSLAFGKLNETKIKREKLDQKSRRNILNILSLNEKLHAAFYTYDAKSIEELSSRMKQLLGPTPNKDLEKIFKKIKPRLERIKSKGKRKGNNKLYHEFSKGLVTLVKKYDLGGTYNVYYCPMIKMRWIQNSVKMNKVHNPYAPRMPHCGVKETKY